MTDANEPYDDTVLAAEYVLRLLDAPRQAEVERRLLRDAELAALVHDWEARLAALTDDIAEVVPPAALKTKLTAQLFEAQTPRVSRWAGWRVWLMGGAAAVALVVGLMVMQPRWLGIGQPGFVPVAQADLVSEDQSLTLAAQYDAQAQVIRISRQSGAAPAGRVLELWLIAPDAPAPVSLGVLSDQDSTTQVTLTAEQAAAIIGATLAVTDEPVGGAPGGVPTGDVRALGPVVTL